MINNMQATIILSKPQKGSVSENQGAVFGRDVSFATAIYNSRKFTIEDPNTAAEVAKALEEYVSCSAKTSWEVVCEEALEEEPLFNLLSSMKGKPLDTSGLGALLPTFNVIEESMASDSDKVQLLLDLRHNQLSGMTELSSAEENEKDQIARLLGLSNPISDGAETIKLYKFLLMLLAIGLVILSSQYQLGLESLLQD